MLLHSSLESSVLITSIPLLQQYIISVPYLDAYSSISSDGKNPRKTAFSFSSSCVVSEWHHSYTRESDAAHSDGKGVFLIKKNENPSAALRAQQGA